MSIVDVPDLRCFSAVKQRYLSGGTAGFASPKDDFRLTLRNFARVVTELSQVAFFGM